MKGLRKLAALGCLLLVGVLGCSAAEPEPPSTLNDPTGRSGSSESIDSGPSELSTEPSVVIDYQTAVDSTLATFVGEAKGGATVAISFDGSQTVKAAAGSGSVDGSPLDPDSLMRAGSLTNTFMAVIVLQLVEEGAVSLDSAVAGYLPDVTAADGVTVRQLLNHSSGIPDYADAAFVADAAAQPATVWTPALVLDHIASLPQVFPPGSKNEYSNTNYILVGMLIEQVTGQTAAQNLAERITGPLGMVNTFLAPDPERKPVTGFGSELPGGSTQDWDYTSLETAAGTAGALISTAPELVHFLQALVADELISAGSLASMMEFSEPDGYGLGIFPLAFPSGQGFGHDGSIPGFITQFGVEPESGSVFAILCNDTGLYPNDLAVALLALGL